MKREYAPEEKAFALAQIHIHRNNIALVSAQTGIPERTLREWRRIQRIENGLPPANDSAAAAHDFADKAEALQYVYDQFIEEMVNIADTLPELLRTAPPYQQLMTMMKMLDRLETFRLLLPQVTPQHTIRLEFVDPDGTVHDTPSWQRSATSEQQEQIYDDPR